MLRATRPNQYIHISGFVTKTMEGSVCVLIAVDNYSRFAFEPMICQGELTFDYFVKFIQQTLDIPEVKSDLKSVTVVTDLELTEVDSLERVINRPVKFICNHEANEEIVKDVRESLIQFLNKTRAN
jgi:hypothetical protein